MVYAGGKTFVSDFGSDRLWGPVVLRSGDGGTSWTNASGNLCQRLGSTGSVEALWVDPAMERRVLAGTSAGVYVTDDRGEEWAAVGFPFTVSDFAWSQEDGLLFAATTQAGVYISSDRGATWQAMNEGLSRFVTTRLALDAEQGYLYAGTSGGGLWRRTLRVPQPAGVATWVFYD